VSSRLSLYLLSCLFMLIVNIHWIFCHFRLNVFSLFCIGSVIMSLSSIHITMLILSLLLVCAFFILSLYSAYIPVNSSFSCCHCHTLFSSLPKPVLTWMSLVCNLLFCCMLLSLLSFGHCHYSSSCTLSTVIFLHLLASLCR